MNINYKESQIDFLSHVKGRADEPSPPRYMAAQISLSLENLVILSIVAIMILVFSFAMGIERGKRAAASGSYPASTDVASMAAPADKTPDNGEARAEKDDALKAKPGVVAARVMAKAAPAVDPKIIPADTAAPAGPLNGAYTLQVASYKNSQPAQREADKLKQKGFRDVYVLPKGAYVIVCVGNFTRKEDASGVKRQLKSRYQDFVVRRL